MREDGPPTLVGGFFFHSFLSAIAFAAAFIFWINES